MMLQLEQDFGRRVDWFAVSHERPEHRHVHVVAVSKQRLAAGQFRSMREAGDGNALQQREQGQQLDRKGDKRFGSARSPARDRGIHLPGPATRKECVDRGALRGFHESGSRLIGDR
jgi:hypothetical protein